MSALLRLEIPLLGKSPNLSSRKKRRQGIHAHHGAGNEISMYLSSLSEFVKKQLREIGKHTCFRCSAKAEGFMLYEA